MNYAGSRVLVNRVVITNLSLLSSESGVTVVALVNF